MGYFSGHLFLNMTEGTALSSGILGNSLEQYSLSIAGRVVDELVPKPPKPFPRRLVNTVRLTTFALTAGPHIRRLDKKLAVFEAPVRRHPTSAARRARRGGRALQRGDADPRAFVVPLGGRSQRARGHGGQGGGQGGPDRGRGSRSGLRPDGRRHRRRERHDARPAGRGRVRAGRRRGGGPPLPRSWTRRGRGLGGRRQPARRPQKFNDFLARHGHRGYRELCLRDPSWGDDPEGLGTIMQAMLRARLATGNAARPDPDGRRRRPPSRAAHPRQDGSRRSAWPRGDQVPDGAGRPPTEPRLPAPR